MDPKSYSTASMKRFGLRPCLFVAMTLQFATMAAGPVGGDEIKANKLFGAKVWSSQQSASPIGSYARGCLAGGIRLPESGPTWQAMRLSRNRNWGHPVLIEYLVELSAKAHDLGWAGLYIGDLTQPRGGPMTSSHASHQIGLDADIWLRIPDRLDLTVSEREEISSISVRSADQTYVNDYWTDSHMQILKTAADDPRVDRIFVTPAIKVKMCEQADDDRMWLQKIRQYYGHHYHFHVRLKCPQDATDCITQKPTVSELSNGGDGCDRSLQWWVTGYLESLKKPPPDPPPPRPRGARDFVMADLPDKCQEVLEAP